jgi:hypothetical protein
MCGAKGGVGVYAYVMIGGAAESIILDVRDVVRERLMLWR